MDGYLPDRLCVTYKVLTMKKYKHQFSTAFFSILPTVYSHFQFSQILCSAHMLDKMYWPYEITQNADYIKNWYWLLQKFH